MKNIQLTAFDFGLDEKENKKVYSFSKEDFVAVKLQIEKWNLMPENFLMLDIFGDNYERS